MTKGLAQVWSDWGIQILVLLSFTLQVMLLLLAGIRRRKSSAALRLLLWLMYLLADSTAIYTLGHLSVASSKKNARDDDQQQQQVVAFWAPFLLVHLGGPGTITAYSLEDNRLWLRHLLTLAVQVLGAAFVVYRYIAGGRHPLLLLAAVLVFVVGVLRYGERTWALWTANTGSIRSTLKYPPGEERFNLSHWGEKLRWPCPREDEDNSGVDDEQLLLGAHSLLHISKSMFVDATLYLSDFNRICTRWYGGKDVPRLAELELSLMYDILYTKAAVVHTWCGYAILVVSPLATAAAFLLFHWSSSSRVRGGNKQLVNVGITYALLSGTLALETIAMVRAMGSTWACALMYCCGWNRLLGAVTALRRRVGAASKRRWWPGSMGQFNLLHLSTRDRAELGNRVAPMLGLRSLWTRAHFSGTTTISTTDLKDRIQRSFGSKIDGTGGSRGVRILEANGLTLTSQGNAYSFAHGTLTGAFDDSILYWHIATDIYLSETKVEHEEQLVAAVQVLSNYMMFLLVAQSDMLPGPIRQGQYLDTCNELDQVWDKIQGSLPAPDGVPAPPHRWMMSMLKKLFQPDKPNGASSSRLRQRKELATKLLGGDGHDEKLIESGPIFFLTTRPSIEGPRLAADLLRVDSDSMLEMIFGIWAEMLCYAAHHCSRDSHARHLNNGGEFITVLWLWTQYQPLVG